MRVKDAVQNRTVIVLVVMALGIGFLLRGCFASRRPHTEAPGAGPAAVADVWTCSMHPQIRLPKFGLCPICNMDLIPAGAAADSGGPRELKLSEQARRLAEIEVAPVERKWVAAEIRLTGKIQYDETRLVAATARVAGRLDRLYIDYTGAPVNKGDPLVQIYSPDLLSAQEEFLQARQAADALKAGPGDGAKPAAARTLDAAREKLTLLGLTAEQIADIEQRGATTDHIDIAAPISGVVVARNVLQGAYVETGTPLYTIADLSQVWLILDAYETDLAWIRQGQEVECEAQAYPGETFKGTVSFIDPVVTDRTRTVRLRVNLPNPDGRLKPDMFARGVVRAAPPAGTDAKPPLVIPATAPLLTGQRAIAYVEDPDHPGVYAFRPIRLGARAGDYYIVEQGLREGERVVVHGSFKIDSAMQLLAKPSLMSAVEQPVEVTEFDAFEVPEAFRNHLGTLYAAYFKAHLAFSRDQLPDAQQAARECLDALGAIDTTGLDDDSRAAWAREAAVLKEHAGRMAAAEAIGIAREAFSPLSESLISVVRQFGSAGDRPILRFHCPMAFDDRGADWLQDKPGVENPYFGAGMFRCGEQVEIVHPGTAGQEDEP